MKNIIWLVLAIFMFAVIGCAGDDASTLPNDQNGPALNSIDLDAMPARALGAKRQLGATLAPAYDGDTDGNWLDITGGTFTMGNDNAYAAEAPAHSVTVGSFEMMRGEASITLYHLCVLDGNCDEPLADYFEDPVYTDTDTTDTDPGTITDTDSGFAVHCWHDHYTPERFNSYAAIGDFPMACLTYTMAEQFCNWIDPTNNSRLPSEAEWEYAARSEGQDFNYPWEWDTADLVDSDTWGDCDHAMMRSSLIPEEAYTGCDGTGGWTELAWEACDSWAYPETNNTEQGLCDMSGNLAEWVADVYHPTYDGAPTDGSAWMDATGVRDDIHVLRGGHTSNFAGWVRTTSRSYNAAWVSHGSRAPGPLGVRCVRDDI